VIKIFGFELYSKNEMLGIRQGMLAQSRAGFKELDGIMFSIKSVKLENIKLHDQNRKLLQQLAAPSILDPQSDG